MKPDKKKKVLPSGATRTNIDHVRYDLISPYGHERLAKRYALGVKRHEERGWEAGMPDGEIINHIKKHITEWEKGDRSDDHWAAVAWGAYAMMHFDSLKKLKKP